MDGMGLGVSGIAPLVGFAPVALVIADGEGGGRRPRRLLAPPRRELLEGILESVHPLRLREGEQPACHHASRGQQLDSPHAPTNPEVETRGVVEVPPDRSRRRG